MRENEVVAMGEQDATYWWHVCRRLVWRSIFNKWLPNSYRHSGDPTGQQKTPESYNSYDAGPILRSKSYGELTQGRMINQGQILDVGCGSGVNLHFLKDWGRVVGIDQSEVALNSARQHGEVERGDALSLPRADESIDLLTAFDVLEHLADDGQALMEWARVIKPGGYVAISVPAYQWLYGPHDRELLHHRRYTKAELNAKLSRAGLQPIFTSYAFMFTFPIFVLQRLLAKGIGRGGGYNSAPVIVNQLLIGLGRLEAKLVKLVALPFGSSVFVLSKKP